MLVFFVNGFLKVYRSNGITKYLMRFLTESYEKCEIVIRVFDENDNCLEFEHNIEGKQIIKIDCTKLMSVYNWEGLKYKYVSYEVVYKDCEQPVYRGSFPLIAPDYNGELKFVTLTGNLNQRIDDESDYEYRKEEETPILWSHIGIKRPDIIFHLGDLIDGTYIWKRRIGMEHGELDGEIDGEIDRGVIYSSYINLYKTAYSEEHQGDAMRNCLNFSIMGDCDIAKNFPIKKKDSFKPYHEMGRHAWVDYCLCMVTDNSIDSTCFITRRIGKYLIVGLDSINRLYTTNMLYNYDDIENLMKLLATTTRKEILILNHLSFGNLSKIGTMICGLFNKRYKMESFHPRNIRRTLDLIDTIYNNHGNKEIKLLATNKNYSYINSIQKDSNKVFTQYTINSLNRKEQEKMIEKIVCTLFNKTGKFREDGYHITEKITTAIRNSYGMFHQELYDCYH